MMMWEHSSVCCVLYFCVFVRCHIQQDCNYVITNRVFPISTRIFPEYTIDGRAWRLGYTFQNRITSVGAVKVR